MAAAAAMLSSMAPSDEMFKSLLDSTYTEEEKERMAEEEEQRQLEVLEEQRKERLAAMGLSTVLTTNK